MKRSKENKQRLSGGFFHLLIGPLINRFEGRNERLAFFYGKNRMNGDIALGIIEEIEVLEEGVRI